MSTKREQFAALLSEAKAHRSTFRDLSRQLDETFESVVFQEWKTSFPRRRKFSLKKAEKDLGEAAFDHLVEKHNALVDATGKGYFAKRDDFEDRLAKLAEDLTPEPGLKWAHWGTKWSSNWGSQGFGALKYAQNAAEMKADVARFYKLEVEIRLTNERMEKKWSLRHGHYEIWVKADELDLEILSRKPGPSLREQVRLCWARGVNPRVFNPYLPPGYESAEGLDFFGNDLRAEQPV